jgi:heavy metal translocating P-type ATPase
MMFAYPLYATYFSYDGEGYGSLFAWLSLLSSVPVITYSAWPIWRRFWTSCKVGVFGMEVLVAIGVATAFGLSVYDMWMGGIHVYFDSMTVIIAFVLLGKIIEARAKFSAKESLFRLSRSVPRKGRKRFEDGTLRFIPAKDIFKGDVIEVYAGEKIPLDGKILSGEGACDESLMTGEVIPVVKKIGDGVLGGAHLVQGNLIVEVCSDSDQTALHKIIEMVEHDIGHKGVYARAADRIVKWFVPTVIAFALFVGLISWGVGTRDSGASVLETAFLRAIAVLLISCPCAIGIAAPTAESYLLSGLASFGAIVRNRGCLSFLGRETVFVFDKTGTATEGVYGVVNGLENLDENQKSVLKGLAECSIHPIPYAIVRAIKEEGIRFDKLEEVVGFGMRGNLGDKVYFLGSARFMEQQGIPFDEDVNEQGEVVSTVYFADQQQVLACLHLGDTIRPGMKELLQRLRPAHSILLSGDSEKPVAAVGKACGFDHWYSGCSPLEKREFIEALKKQGEVVCMLGDGINDAPALTSAQVGVSVVSATDISIQVSDLLLTTDRIEVVAKIRQLAERGKKIIQQNLFWAFFYNVIGIFLAAFGVLSPIFAAFAMAASSLTVLFNARRV